MGYSDDLTPGVFPRKCEFGGTLGSFGSVVTFIYQITTTSFQGHAFRYV